MARKLNFSARNGDDVIKSEKYEKAFNAYINSAGNMSRSQIAECVGVTPQTVKRWAVANDWENTLTALTAKRFNDQNGVAELLPKQTAQILGVIKNSSGEEILWQNILLQYAAIIRAQQLMDVENKDILALEKQRIYDPEHPCEEWENHTPWERYKIFLETQSKAMNSLTSMLKKLDEYKHSGLLNDELSAKIALMKRKTDELSSNADDITVVCNLPDKGSK